MSRRRSSRVPPTRRTLWVLPSIPDELDEQTKNAVAIRNARSVEGRCPCCGCRGEISRPDELGVWHAIYRHESWCRALTDEAAA